MSSPSRRRTRVSLAICAVGVAVLASVTPATGAVRPHDASASYSCADRALSVGGMAFPVAVTGNTPTSVSAPVAQVSMSDVQGALTIPASALDKPMSKGATTVTATVNTFDINASDARVKTMNVTNSPVTVGPVTLVAGQPAVLIFPSSPTTTGIWGAKKVGTMTFTTGKITMELDLGPPGTSTLRCKPKPPAVISTTTVT